MCSGKSSRDGPDEGRGAVVASPCPRPPWQRSEVQQNCLPNAPTKTQHTTTAMPSTIANETNRRPMLTTARSPPSHTTDEHAGSECGRLTSQSL
jgi:hypothetical protein